MGLTHLRSARAVRGATWLAAFLVLAACGGGRTGVLAPVIPDDRAVSQAAVTVSIAAAIDDDVTVHDAGGGRPLRLRGYRSSLAAAIAALLPDAITASGSPGAADQGLLLSIRAAAPAFDSRGDGSVTLDVAVEVSARGVPMEPAAYRWQERVTPDRERGADAFRGLEVALGRMGASVRQIADSTERIAGNAAAVPIAQTVVWLDAPPPSLARVSLGIGSGVAVRVARMDADDRPDLLVLTRPANGRGELFVVFDAADWNDAGGPVIPVPEGPSTFVAVDCEDGLTDIVYPAPDTPFVIALQQAKGGLRPITLRMPLPDGAVDGTVSAGFAQDLDGDGRPDYGFWYGGPAVVAAMLRQGPSREDPARIVLGERMSRVNAVLAEDLDGDGRPEIMLAGLGRAGRVTIVRDHFDPGGVRRMQELPTRGQVVPMLLSARTKDGTLLFSAVDVSGGSADLALADLDGDGRTDLISADGAGGTLSVMRAEGADAFGLAPIAFPAPEGTELEPRRVAITDLDDDSLPDLIVLLTAGVRREGLLHPAESWIAAVRGRGDGGFEPVWTLTLHQVASDLAVEDLDGDGRDDYLVTGRSDTVLYLTGPAGS